MECLSFCAFDQHIVQHHAGTASAAAANAASCCSQSFLLLVHFNMVIVCARRANTGHTRQAVPCQQSLDEGLALSQLQQLE